MSQPLRIDRFVCTTIAQACNEVPDAVVPETALLDLKMDSVTLVSVLAQIEAVYEIELSGEQMLSVMEASHVSDVVDCVERILERA